MEKAIAWFDVEASGRSPELDELLEVALVVTDFHGRVLADDYSSLVQVRNLKEVMNSSSLLVHQMHESNGLWSDLWEKQAKAPEQIDEELCAVLRNVDNNNVFFLGGNSPILDRMFAQTYLPNFNEAISHMSVDVTTLASVLQEKLKAPRYPKQQAHRSLADVYDSIKEYRHYLEVLERNTR